MNSSRTFPRRLLPAAVAAVAVVLSGGTACAEDASRITAVTLYPGSATIERTARVEPGMTLLQISGLPANFDPQSVRVDADAGVALGEVNPGAARPPDRTRRRSEVGADGHRVPVAPRCARRKTRADPRRQVAGHRRRSHPQGRRRVARTRTARANPETRDRQADRRPRARPRAAEERIARHPQHSGRGRQRARRQRTRVLPDQRCRLAARLSRQPRFARLEARAPSPRHRPANHGGGLGGREAQALDRTAAAFAARPGSASLVGVAAGCASLRECLRCPRGSAGFTCDEARDPTGQACASSGSRRNADHLQHRVRRARARDPALRRPQGHGVARQAFAPGEDAPARRAAPRPGRDRHRRSPAPRGWCGCRARSSLRATAAWSARRTGTRRPRRG